MEITAQELEAQLAALPTTDSPERVDLVIQLVRAVVMADPPRATELGREALEMSRRLDYQKGIGFSLYHLGFGEYLRSDHERAMATLLEAQRLMDAIEDESGRGMVLGSQAAVHLSVGEYEKALSCSFEALKAHRQTGDRSNEAWQLHVIGGGYHEMGDYPRALQYHGEALQVFEELDLDVGRARALTGLGLVHQARREFDQALEVHGRSLELFRRAGNGFGESRALNDLGVTLQEMGEFGKARENHLRALELREEFGNKQAVSTSLINLGKLLLAEGRPEEALDYVQRALGIAEQIKAKPRIFQSHLVLSEIRSLLGDPAAALEHYKSYERVKEEVAGDQANLRLTNLQVGFEMEQAERDAEISRLKNVELRQKNEQLQTLLNELHTAQAQLIQSEKMAVLGSLVSGLLHEFNTPLGAITGTSDVTNRCVDRIRQVAASDHAEILNNRKFAQALDILERNHELTRTATARIGQITRSLEGFTNLDGGTLASVDVNQNLEHTLTLLEYEYRDRVEVVWERGEVPPVLSDPRDLSQVFMTLLTNAGEAIKERGTVTVKTDFVGEHVQVEIRDTGVGMDAAALDTLFEPSFSDSGERIKSGMGLMAASNIMLKMGGGISADSEVGAGSVFRVWLPLSAPIAGG